jgi:hypothetical protein
MLLAVISERHPALAEHLAIEPNAVVFDREHIAALLGDRDGNLGRTGIPSIGDKFAERHIGDADDVSVRPQEVALLEEGAL